MAVPTPTVYFPYLPAMSPYRLPKEPFEQIIDSNGISLYWFKSHTCACVYGNQQTPGAANPSCNTCHGRGVYWDQGIGPWKGLITLIHTSPTPDEPGVKVDTDQGALINGEPTLTIPFSGGWNSPGFLSSSGIWGAAKLYDMFCEAAAISTFNSVLTVSGNTTLPYPHNVSVPLSGAVSVYNVTGSIVVTGVPYSVSGVNVTVTGYPAGTNYVVEYQAAPAYVGFRIAGMPAHVRPFQDEFLPRRFRLMTLDLWLRSRYTADIPYVSGGSPY